MAAKSRSCVETSSRMRIAHAVVIRDPGAAPELLEVRSSTTRRHLLGALALAPLGALSIAEVSRLEAPINVQSELAPLLRTKQGRRLSRARYHRAESFFVPMEHGFPFRRSDQLYQIGIVLQLALSAHLLDVGFADAWCAKNIGLCLNRSLQHANATGLGHDSPELEELAEFLSPYGRWRNPDGSAAADACPFSPERVCALTREILERVREVTGHPRPRRRTDRNG